MVLANKSSTRLEVNWNQLRSENLFLLKDDLLKTLIDNCVKKYGSVNRASKITGLTYPSLYYARYGKIKMISVGKLKTISDNLGLDYSFFNDKILEIRKGDIASIKNPVFPIKLSSPEVGALLGFVCSDGWIHIDKKARMAKRTLYSSDDTESVDAFIGRIKSVFGNVHIQREFINGHLRIRIGSSIIGDSLESAGAIVGNKTKLNGGVPWVVKDGSVAVKREYLRAAFSDEGSVGRIPRPFVTLSRYNKVNLPESHVCALNNALEDKMSTHTFPTGHIHKKIGFRKASDILEKSDIENKNYILQTIKKSVPRLLLDESSILRKDFGIENSIYIIDLNKTGSGYYTLNCNMVIGGKADVVKFYNDIGFILTRKQNKLKSFLMEKDSISKKKGGKA